MAKKGGDNSKKAQGQARKADAALKKQQAAADAAEAQEAAEWNKGAKKGNAKKEADAARKEEAARKKAEREAMLAEEEALMPSKPLLKGRGAAKVALRRTGKIDDFINGPTETISASGIDGALEALELATHKLGGIGDKDIERHPERRFKAALAQFEERRLPEVRKENPGLRLQQCKQLVFKEFEKSDENPFNHTVVAHNATADEVRDRKNQLRAERESRYA